MCHPCHTHPHASHVCGTWHIHFFEKWMTNSPCNAWQIQFLMRDQLSFLCVTYSLFHALYRACDMTHTHTLTHSRASYVCGTWPFHVFMCYLMLMGEVFGAVVRVWHIRFRRCVTRDTTYAHVTWECLTWLTNTHVTWPIHTCYTSVWHVIYMCVTCDIHMCDMTCTHIIMCMCHHVYVILYYVILAKLYLCDAHAFSAMRNVWRVLLTRDIHACDVTNTHIMYTLYRRCCTCVTMLFVCN